MMSDAQHKEPAGPPLPQASDELPVLIGKHTYGSVTDKICDIVLTRHTPWFWWAGFSTAVMFLGALLATIYHVLTTGIGAWGNNIPVAWAFPIVNFVWWIGIGHAGTFISAFLLLLRQEWRTSINRFAEAMTLFAVTCAGIFPLMHLGRPWLFYWLFPYPNTMTLWPQFRSPLLWDVFAVSTYATVSFLFWYAGLIPDVAAMRDKAQNHWARLFFGVLALGWRGSARHWQHHQSAYLLLGGLGTPLVLSVHSIVGLDFAVSLVPGWHSTIFPPYFVAGAIFSGFAMVLTLAIPLRYLYGLEELVTLRHLNNAAKVLLVTGSIVSYGYLMEAFFEYYSGDIFERFLAVERATGPYAWSFWSLIGINMFAPQLFWFSKVRQNVKLLWVLSLVIQVGMWLERFVIVVISLQKDFLPSSWHTYYPTIWDFSMFFGTIGLFFTLFFLFIRLLPMIAISEVRELVHIKQEHVQ
jgi:molybdopterin-containing oxidoreductase family membrane subunit